MSVRGYPGLGRPPVFVLRIGQLPLNDGLFMVSLPCLFLESFHEPWSEFLIKGDDVGFL